MRTLLRMAFSMVIVLCPIGAAQAITIGYSSISDPSANNLGAGSMIHFNGDSTFEFINTNTGSGHHDIFQIDSVTGGTGAANKLFGDITGEFTIGAISGFSAPVTGPGILTIHATDAAFIAAITWVDIFEFKAVGGLNAMTATVNMTSVSYAGSNADLLAFADAGSASNVVSFQFTTLLSLQQLKTSVHDTSSFSGAMTAVPEPGSLAMLALGALAFIAGRPGLRRRAT